MRPVPTVVGIALCQRLQHLLARRGGSDRRGRSSVVSCVGQLSLHVLSKVLCKRRPKSRISSTPKVKVGRGNVRLLMSVVGASLLRPNATSLICDGSPNSLLRAKGSKRISSSSGSTSERPTHRSRMQVAQTFRILAQVLQISVFLKRPCPGFHLKTVTAKSIRGARSVIRRASEGGGGGGVVLRTRTRADLAGLAQRLLGHPDECCEEEDGRSAHASCVAQRC